MNIFVVNFLLTLIWAFLFLYKKSNDPEQNKKNKKAFVIIVCVQWVLISGLRSDYTGSDTGNYMSRINGMVDVSWLDVLKNFYTYFFGGESDSMVRSTEPGFYLFEKLIATFVKTKMAYKFIVAIIFTSALGNYIYKYSEEPFISILIYDAVFYNMFSLTGYRQVISVAIIGLYGYQYVLNRNFGKYLTLLLISCLFHKSSVIFILLYFFANTKQTPAKIIAYIAAIIPLIIFRNSIFGYAKVLMGYEEYGGSYGFRQQNFLILLLIMTILLIYYRKGILEQDNPYVTVHYNGLILSWFMFPLAMVSPTSMRLVYDFGMSYMALTPLLFKSFDKKNDRFIAYTVTIILLGYFIVTRSPDYNFFWHDQTILFRSIEL